MTTQNTEQSAFGAESAGRFDAFRVAITGCYKHDIEEMSDFYMAATDALLPYVDVATITPTFRYFDQNLRIEWKGEDKTVIAYITKDDDGVFEVQVFFEVESTISIGESVDKTTVVMHDMTTTSTLAIYDFKHVEEFLNGN
jgi:hypothetical protein